MKGLGGQRRNRTDKDPARYSDKALRSKIPPVGLDHPRCCILTFSRARADGDPTVYWTEILSIEPEGLIRQGQIDRDVIGCGRRISKFFLEYFVSSLCF